MELKEVAVTQASIRAPSPFQIKLTFGKRACCGIEVSWGDSAAVVAEKLHELAEQLDRLDS